MSASIHYRPVNPSEVRLEHYGSGSWFKRVIEKAFEMELPYVFDLKDCDKLRAMAAMCDEKNGFQEIIEALHKHGSVEVFVRY